MARFLFEVRAADGRMLRGELDATNEIEARVKLRAQQLTPLRVVPKAGQKAKGPSGIQTYRRSKVPGKDLQVFTRQLATLVNSGVHIIQSLDMLARGSKNPSLKRCLRDVMDSIEKGKNLASSLESHPYAFDRLYVNLVRAGEEGGVLDVVLERLAGYIERSVKLMGKIRGAMWYPGIVTLVSVGVISAILIFVIPKFQTLFGNSGKELPALTVVVINASNFMVSNWYLVFGALTAMVIAVKKYYQTRSGRWNIDSLLLKVPVFGEVLKKGGIARFTRTLATLLGSGVSILEALEISSQVAGNVVIEKILADTKDAVVKGKNLSVPLSQAKIVPQMVVQMIEVGEQTGALDTMLGKVADFYESEVETAIATMTSLMEPILMVFLGGIVAVLLIAMYLPIFHLADAVGG